MIDQRRLVLRAHLACPPPAWPLSVQHKKQEGVALTASAVTPGLGGRLTPGGRPHVLLNPRRTSLLGLLCFLTSP